MNIQVLIEYLLSQGWKETKFSGHYSKKHIIGLVVIEPPEAYIIERYGEVPWSRITSVVQFEQDLAHLQPVH